MIVVHLVRHGHVHNPERVLYGRLPEYRLSDAGERMAEETARFFAESGRDIARVVSSPLLRAQQTAAAIGVALGLPVETDDRLIEADNVWEGRRIHPIARLALDPRTLWRIRNPWRPSWGEPYVAQRDRMTAAVLDAAAAEPDRETVLVSHQLPIWVTRLAAEGRALAHNPSVRECALASVTSLFLDAGAIVGVEYSEPAAGIVVSR